MTERRSFKRIVRARMEKTGESYTAARASLLAGPGAGDADVVMPQSDDAVRGRTGHGWERWIGVLDDWGGTERTHTEIARHLREEHGVDGWWSQAIAVGYERARGMRAVGERPDGFSVTAQKTVAIGVERLFDGFMDESTRGRWLLEDRLGVRTATRPKSARFDWGDGSTRVIAGFEAKGEAKSTVSISHERLPDAEAADRIKSMWRESVSRLKEELEG